MAAHRSDIGPRLRALRRSRGLSLADVAAATDNSTSFLSLLENGKTDITFGRLIRLVDFYGVSITDLLPESRAADPVVVRKEEQRHVYSPAEGIDVYLLAPDTRRAMMPILAVYEPGGHVDEYEPHQGEEFLHVLEGRIELTLEGASPVILEKGDSAYYKGGGRHAFRNAGRGRARVFAVVTPPTL